MPKKDTHPQTIEGNGLVRARTIMSVDRYCERNADNDDDEITRPNELIFTATSTR